MAGEGFDRVVDALSQLLTELLQKTEPANAQTLAALPAGNNNIGDVDVLTVPAPLSTTGGGVEATALRVTVASNSTGLLPVSDNAGSLTVDAPVGTPVAARLSDGTAFLTAVGGRLSVDASGVAVPVTDNASSLTVDAPVGTPVAARLSDGIAFLTTTGGRLSVDASGVAVPVTDNAGSLTVDQATAANLNAQVVGELAHGAVDAGNPQKIGGRASTAQIAAVASASRADAIFDVHGRQMTRVGNQNFAGNQWTAISLPAANTQATATKASAGAGVRNVCTTLTIVLAATGSAPTATNIAVNLIDGGTGGLTFLWRATISIPATAGAMNGIALSNLWYVGTTATAMTLEFSAAGGANTVESVSMGGVTVAE